MRYTPYCITFEDSSMLVDTRNACSRTVPLDAAYEALIINKH